VGIGKRDFIIVCGLQGYGKSVWTQIYAASKPRLLIYDPKAEYQNVDYMTPPDEWIPDVVNRQREKFRFGTCHAEEVEMFGNAAYAAGRCAFIMEECKMLFDRGEDVAQWARPLIYMGRESALDLVLVAQRIIAIPPDIRSQASRVVTFLQPEPQDCKALSQRFGGDYDDEIRQLPELACLDWQAGKGVSSYSVKP
jgi:hypothetical protein